jgi:hypothetical protein
MVSPNHNVLTSVTWDPSLRHKVSLHAQLLWCIYSPSHLVWLSVVLLVYEAIYFSFVISSSSFESASPSRSIRQRHFFFSFFFRLVLPPLFSQVNRFTLSIEHLKIKSRETINQKNWVSQFLFVCYQAWMNNRWLKDLTIESGQSGRNKKKKKSRWPWNFIVMSRTNDVTGIINRATKKNFDRITKTLRVLSIDRLVN